MHLLSRSVRRPGRGYTLTEFMVVLAVLAVAAGMAFPAINGVFYRAQVRSMVRKTANVIQVARYQAIRRGVPAVVEILPASREVRAFVDVNGPTMNDAPDGAFNPVGGEPAYGTDYILQRFTLGSGLDFIDPVGNTGFAAVDGLDNPAPLPDDQVIFQPNGSVASLGAFRLADRRSNYLEIRVAPAATGRVQIRKWDDTLDVNWDGSHWYAEGEVSRGWNWR